MTSGEWAERKLWLRSLGLTDETIKLYRLDRYQYMTQLAWECMVREALRSNGKLSSEQRRRRRVQYASGKVHTGSTD